MHCRSLLPLLLSLSISASADTNIGVLLPLSGDFARYGDRVRRGIESVQLPGAHLVFEDEGCLPGPALRGFRKLVDADGVRIILGPGCGSPQVVVASALPGSDAIAILTNSAPRRVFERSQGRMLSVQHSIEDESIFNAQKMYELGVRRVVVLFAENDFGRAHEAAFRAEFKGEVVDTLTYSPPDDPRSLIPSIRRSKPDALYVPDAAPLLHGLTRRLAEVGLQNLRIFSVYSIESDDVREAIAGSTNRLAYSHPKIRGDALHEFPARAAKLLASALKACPTSDADCVLHALKAENSFDEFGVLRGELELRTLS